MSHEEKQNAISFITSLIVTIPYLFYIINRYQNEIFGTNEELKFWAAAILLMIPLRIIAMIIGYIIFSIVKVIVTGNDAEEKMITDERDRIIELKGDRNTSNIFIFGFMGALIAVLLGGTISTMFIVLIISGFIAEVIGTLSKTYYYRQGL
jgi:hypothetical protein